MQVQSARACSVCGCGDPLVAAGDSSPSAGSLRIALESEYLSANAQTEEQPLATEYLTQVSVKPILVYSPLDTLNLVLQVPIVSKDWSLSGTGVDSQAVNHAGLGDLDLGARWFLVNSMNLRRKSRQNFAISAGTSFPTGPSNATMNGQRLDDHAQLGTGAYGPYLGALYAYHQDPWNLFLSVTGRAHSTNSFGYHYGNALLWTIRSEYEAWKRIVLVLGIDGRYAARDTLNDDPQSNTGGLVLAATPGVIVNLYEELWIHVRAQIPFATHLFGVQHVSPTVIGSIQYSF
jgi:hypothetical protein